MKGPLIIRAVLWAAMEDYHGIWEYPGEVYGAMGGRGAVPNSINRLSQAILTTYIVDGFVELYWCTEPYGELSRMNSDDALDAATNPVWWAVPNDGAQGVRVGSTSLGADVYECLGRLGSDEQAAFKG